MQPRPGRALGAPPRRPGVGRTPPPALRYRRPCATDSRHWLAVAPNALAQRFEAPAPNCIRLAGIVYIPTGEGWLRFAAALGLAARKVVGWAMRDRMRVEPALSALITAAQRQRPASGFVHHGGRGSQYAAGAYVDQLSPLGATASMSRAGCCRGNAPMEGSFRTLKVELVHQRRWATRDDARRDLFAHIEGRHNRVRIHSAPGHPTPEQAERQAGQSRAH